MTWLADIVDLKEVREVGVYTALQGRSLVDELTLDLAVTQFLQYGPVNGMVRLERFQAVGRFWNTTRALGARCDVLTVTSAGHVNVFIVRTCQVDVGQVASKRTS